VAPSTRTFEELMPAAPVSTPLKPAGRRTRILYLVTRAERGGAQAHVLDMAVGMNGLFEVVVATGEEGFLTEACREQSIPVHVVPNLRREIKPLADLLSLQVLVKLMRRTQPDIVHAHTFKAGFLGRLAAKRLKIACVYTVHMWPFGDGVPMSWRLTAPACERLAARWCDRVITVSEVGAKLASKHNICDLSKVTSIWNGIPDHPARARLERETDLRCTMVARFTAFKDHALLLRAFARVPGDARLVLAGDGGTLAAAKALAAQLGIAERVEFAGVRSDVPDVLARSDVFVLASKQETLPISILEAMRAGLPVIATDVGGIPEEVIHEETGLLVRPGSVEDLSAALSRLLGSRTLRTSMGRAGRKRFEKMFLAQTMISKTAALYDEVLQERFSRR
jgi:glycosyltransferase involved in cell wall biosynthesis